jgi:hypothetical protein
MEYSPDSNDVSTEVEEFPLLKAVAKQRLVKTLEAGEECVVICSVEISDSVIVVCGYDLQVVNTPSIATHIHVTLIRRHYIREAG